MTTPAIPPIVVLRVPADPPDRLTAAHGGGHALISQQVETAELTRVARELGYVEFR
jgi:hypothetical protein